jgi:hypothetical protein
MVELETNASESILSTPTRSFDQRLSSTLSTQNPSKLISSSPSKFNLDTEISISSKNTFQKKNKKNERSFIQWMELTKISDQIYSSASKQENGNPDFIIIDNEYIAIATTKCHILFFNYKQTLLLQLKTTNLHPKTRITSMSLSIDSTYIVVGYSTGLINLWDLKKSDPIISIRPVTVHELQYNGTHHHIAHLEGTPVRRISFIGSRHTGFVSSDDSGIMLLHNGGRSLIGYYCRSKIIHGTFDISKAINDKLNYDKSILDFHLLPIGSKKDITDTMGLMSIISLNSMKIISLNPSITTEFKINKPKIENTNIGLSGHVSWYPATIDNDRKFEILPMLAFSWSNIIYVLEIKSDIKVNEFNEKQPMITIINRREFIYNESIVSLHWLNRNIIIALTRSEKMLFLSSKSLKILQEIDLMAKQLNFNTAYEKNKVGLIEKSYFGSIHTLKSNIFVFQNKNLMIGNLFNWADILLQLLEDGKYLEALEESKRQYEGDDDMALISLPDDNEIRHALMKDYLLRILKSSLKYIFNSDYETEFDFDFKKRTLLAIQTYLTVNAPPEMYDLIYEKLVENNLENLFFEVMENFIVLSKITTFSPTILRAMVTYYIDQQDINTLEQLICLLDIEQLDLDLTVSLCKEYHLNETLTYIWTSLLHDYLTPLVDSIIKIKEFNEKFDLLSENEKQQLRNDVNYVYPYISYTLTGRQYPTDKLLPYVDNPSAKLNIYYFLFSGSAISWPPTSPKIHIVADYTNEPAFPYLYAFLKYDSNGTFSCLNEAFEDDLLNDNEVVSFGSADEKFHLRVNRQYIIDILLGIFRDNTTSNFELIDFIRFAIFVSRNYPKYPQFIRIADSVAEEMIDLLCQARNLDGQSIQLLEDCELALRSLLSIYKPIDVDILILKVEKAKYYEVLLALYQSEERYVDVLNLWVKLEKTDAVKSNSRLFKPVFEIIKEALETVDNYEKKRIIKLLNDNFELFVKSNPKNIAMIVNKTCPELNMQVVNFIDQHTKFMYLKEVFNNNEYEKKMNLKIDENLRIEYLKSLIKQKKEIMDETVGNNDQYVNVEERTLELKSLDEKIKSFVLTLSELDHEITELLQDTNFEVVIAWYVNKENYQAAIDKICEVMITISKNLKSVGYSLDKENEFWKCLHLAFSITSGANNTLKACKKNLNLVEKLSLQITEICVKMFTEVTEDEKVDEKVIDIFKKVVQATFQYIINLSQEDPALFNNIFEKFLDGSSVQVTTLGDIRTVLKEVFLSYSNDTKILILIQSLVDEDIFKNFQILESLQLKGRTPKNIECESCGKKVWGGKVGNEIYESWRDQKLEQMVKDGTVNEHDDEFIHKNELFIFRCKHTYHRKCIENLGMINDNDKKCIICND